MKRENISDALSGLDERMIEPVARLRSGMKREQSGMKQERSGMKQEQSGIKQEQDREGAVAASGPEADDKERERGRRTVRGSRKFRLRGLATAACLCLLCIGAVVTFRLSGEPQGDAPQAASGETGDVPHLPGGATVTPDEEPGEPERTQPADKDDALSDRGDASGETEDAPGDVADAAQEEFVTPESLFAKETDGATENVMMFQMISVGGCQAFYEGVASAGSDVLADNLGAKLEEAKGFYRLKGHDDLQYVISDNGQAGVDVDGESYLLWEFQSFQTEGGYSYGDVLKLIYGLDRPEVIEKIIVMPPNFDNTDAGMQIQKEIGTHEVTDRKDIAAFYEIVSGMTCYGSDHWELIDYGSPDITAEGKGAGAGVRQGRYLTLVTGQGCRIDRLKYTAVSDMFYEYSGVAYEPLQREQAEQIEQMLGI